MVDHEQKRGFSFIFLHLDEIVHDVRQLLCSIGIVLERRNREIVEWLGTMPEVQG
jgi:hypothetical protein